ncbi:MAG: hypothetical protein Q8M00_02755 [bacterium]|nr:hypothetical protein [bacterium]
MKKFKYLFFSLVILGCLFFLFGPKVIPDNFQPQEILETAKNSDVIIIFNSGGWGNTPLEKAEDFAPIIGGMQQTLNEWGYKSVVIPYARTKDNFWGRITGAKEFFNSFRNSSKDLAKEVELLGKKFPDKKIIVAGLSSGGTFVNETIKKISNTVQNSVYAITAGTPFWTEKLKSENILQLDNNGKDTLAIGEVKSLLLSLIKAPFTGKFYAPGHDYSWSSLEVSSQIVTFLENKLR